MKYAFYTGSYASKEQKGIARFVLDTERGSLEEEKGWSGFVNPSYVIRNQAGDVLYAVEELTPAGRVHALRFQDDKLVSIGTLPSEGADPCHLCLWPDERTLMVSNYTDGSFALYRASQDGSLALVQKGKHTGNGPNPARQECAHLHFAALDGSRVYVADLGTDCVHVYEMDEGSGLLTEMDICLRLPAGAGPRHLVIAPNGCIYVVCELSCQVAVFRREQETYECIQRISTLPQEACPSIAAAIRLEDDRLLVSNRGHDSLTLFSVEADGTLRWLDNCAVGGCVPRDFYVFGNWIVIANQESSTLTTLKLEENGQRLVPAEAWAETARPTCICPC